MAFDASRRPPGFNSPSKKRDFDRVSEALLGRAEEVCRYLLPGGRAINGEWRVGSIDGERGKSMGVNLREGVWKDFASDAGGSDLISLWSAAKGIKMHEAYDDAAAWAGIAETPNKPVAPTWKAKTQPPADPKAADPEGDFWEKWRKAPLVASWEYYDGDGALWVTVCRKDFDGGKHIRPWNGTDWKWPEGQRPLYNLADIKAASVVVLVEGEKCAERMRALGYTATTMPGGAQAARVVDWSPLAGKTVIRWRDNDKAGLDWLEKTGHHLASSTVRDVVIPAGKPEGWDCADAGSDEVLDLMRAVQEAPERRVIKAAPLALPDLMSIPKRRFVYDRSYQRGTITVTAGEGGSGKSALHVVEALCIATGRDLLETGKPIERTRVWLVALEDDETEMHRRIGAAIMHFKLDRREIGGWLFLTTRQNAPDFLIAMSDKSGTLVSDANIAAFKREVAENDIGVVIFDPYVYLHMTNENDNSAQATVMKALAGAVNETNVACAIVHHAKKPNADSRAAPSAGDIRGAGAIVNSARSGRVVNTMTQAQADKLGIDERDRWAYFQASSVKANYAPRSGSGDWYKLHGVRLPNGEHEEEGDSVGVVTRWKAPDAFQIVGVTTEQTRQVQNLVEQSFSSGNPISPVSNSRSRLPYLHDEVAGVLGLAIDDRAAMHRVKNIIEQWMKNGVLRVETWQNDSRKSVTVVRRGTTGVYD